MRRLLPFVCALLLLHCKRVPAAFSEPCTTDCDAPTSDMSPKMQGPGCGNGEVGVGEECDAGIENGDQRECTSNCRLNVCGDGLVRSGSEGCDDGNRATEACAYGQMDCTVCRADCTPGPGVASYCGDGVTSAAHGEACDAGSSPSLACPYGFLSCNRCAADCQWRSGTLSYCGDGVVQASEQCDSASFMPPPCPYGATGCSSCDRSCNAVAGATAFCGDGVVNAPDETCDLSGPGCSQCQTLPGWTCNTSCVQRVYRVALMDTAPSGGLRVRDFSSTGAPVATRDVLRGSNAASLRPAWSWNGALVAYPVGDYPNQTYIYEGSGAAAASGSFVGTQPSFGFSPSTVIARHVDGYVTWDVETQVSTVGAIGGANVRMPDYEPGSTTRFAFLDGATGATDNLVVYTGSASLSVDANVQSYAWSPNGGQLAYVSGAGTCSVKTADVQALSAGPPVVVATGAPCGAQLAYAPGGNTLGVATGNEIFRLDLTATMPYDLSVGVGLAYTTPGTILDLGFTPDDQFLAYLAHPSGTTGDPHLYLLAPGATGTIDSGVSCECGAMALSPVVVFP